MCEWIKNSLVKVGVSLESPTSKGKGKKCNVMLSVCMLRRMVVCPVLWTVLRLV